MPTEPLLEQLSNLRRFDIATLFARVITDIHERMEANDHSTAEFLLAGWEDALGGTVADFGRRAREADGQDGYRGALARFTRQQQWRRVGLEQLHYGMHGRIRRSIDRWRWIAAAYRRDVAGFLGGWELARSLGEKKPRARDSVRESKLKGRPILSALVTSYGAPLRLPNGETPALQVHALRRVRQLVDAAQALLQEDASQLSLRDQWRQRARELEIDPGERQRIELLPALRLQIIEYRRFVHDLEHHRHVSDLSSAMVSLASDLDSFGKPSGEAEETRFDALRAALASARPMTEGRPSSRD